MGTKIGFFEGFFSFFFGAPKACYTKLQSNFVKRSAGAPQARSIKSSTPRQRFYLGFTLLEVMVALAILATSFAAVLSLHSDSMDLIIESRFQTKASQLAQYKMNEIGIMGIKNISFNTGEFSDFAPRYVWEIETEPTPVPAWIKVIVNVNHRETGKGGTYRLTQYMLAEPMQYVPWE